VDERGRLCKQGCLKKWIFPKDQGFFTHLLKFSTVWREFEGDVARGLPSSMASKVKLGRDEMINTRE